MFKKVNFEKKVLTIIIASLLVSLFIIGIVSAADVGYILRYDSKADRQVLNVFKALGLTYDLIEDANIYKYDLSKYKFLFIDDVRLSNAKTLPIYNYPSVIMNGYHGEEWGLTDNDGLSQLSANYPLAVKLTNNGVKQVYTKAVDSGKYLFYYYMDDNSDGLNDFNTVARTWAGIGNKFSDVGDVIAVAPAGTVLMNGKVSKGNMCFYGLVKTEFWTEEAKQMFKDCIGYVGVVCSQNSDCPSVLAGQPYCKDDDVYQDSEEYECQNPGTVQSKCVDDVVSNKIKDCEFGCLNGECKPECTSSDLINCESESYSNNYCKTGNVVKDHIIPSCSLTKTCMTKNETETVETCPFGCANGQCIVQCSINSQCGTSGLLDQPYCKDNKVYDKEVTFTCNSPGTKNSYCSNSTTEKLIATCTDRCSDGKCVTIICDDDSDCDDSNAHTQDKCLNPGTQQSSCEHKLIKCLNNAECGTDGLLGQLFCNNNDIFDKYKTYICNNPGTPQSSCSDSTEDKLFTDCPNKCLNGECIRCTVGSDCNDSNPGTEDKCLNPGTPQSSCQNLPIKCSSNSQCGTDGFTENKYCLGGDSYEDFVTYTCNNPNTAQSSCTSISKPVLKKSCESECINGECITCFGDNDCGNNGFIGSPYCSGKNIFQDYKTYTCLNPGTKESSCTDSNENKLKQICSGACFKGQCKDIKCNSNVDCDDNDAYTEDECNNPGTTSSYCSNTLYNCITDRDCGITGFSGEEFCMINNVFKMQYTSKCINPMTTNSYCDNSVVQKLIVDCGKDSCDSYGSNYCKNGNVYHSRTCYDRGCANQACFATPSNDESLVEQCSNGCSDGKCTTVIIKCYKDSDCDDSNLGTIDKCLNPGTADSYCTNTPVVCNKNLDCGTDGFINGLFCQNNNVFQNYITYTCLNPGTVISSCTSSTIDKLKQTCPQGQICNNEACVPVTCDENSDCGTDSFLNQLFCKNNDVFDKYKTYTCNNPGTPQSSCSNLISDVLKQTCAQNQICSNGNCVNINIPCSSDSQCDDSNAHTADKCNNPGTPQSFCSHIPIICLNNAECGTDGFVDGLFCQNNDVFQNYLTFTCNNPGTIQSSCSVIGAPQLKQICPQGQICSNGACVPVACDENSDCGTDHFLNQLFCKNNDIFDKFKKFKCNNPGQINSYCSDSVIDKLKETCPEGKTCENGECVTPSCECHPGVQVTFSNHQIYYDADSRIPDTGYYADSPTALFLCKVKGYDNLVSFIPQYNFFTSPFDNFMRKSPDGTAYQDIPATGNNVGIDSVTCTKNICTGDCPLP